MAGITATIDFTVLREQWLSYRPMAEIAQHWTITGNQLIRLRVVLGFPPRNDRKRRHKPTRDDRILDPSPVPHFFIDLKMVYIFL
jgi:hypothetical protein